jgi:hypothetical protein
VRERLMASVDFSLYVENTIYFRLLGGFIFLLISFSEVVIFSRFSLNLLSFILLVNLFFTGEGLICNYLPLFLCYLYFHTKTALQMWCFVVFFTQILFPKEEMDQG